MEDKSRSSYVVRNAVPVLVALGVWNQAGFKTSISAANKKLAPGEAFVIPFSSHSRKEVKRGGGRGKAQLLRGF